MRTPDEIMQDKGYNVKSLREMMEQVRNWASVYRQEFVEQLEVIINTEDLDGNQNDEDFATEMHRLLEYENDQLEVFESKMDEMIGIWINDPKYYLTREHDFKYVTDKQYDE